MSDCKNTESTQILNNVKLLNKLVNSDHNIDKDNLINLKIELNKVVNSLNILINNCSDEKCISNNEIIELSCLLQH